MSWAYNETQYTRTREIEIIQADDELWYWLRHRTGEDNKVVAQSGGFIGANWCYISAVKENWPLAVPVPEGVEAMQLSEGDGPVPDFPPFPPLEPLSKDEQKKADKEAKKK